MDRRFAGQRCRKQPLAAAPPSEVCMRISRSISLPLIGLLVLVSSGSAIVSHWSNVRAIRTSLETSERDRALHIGSIAETAIRAEAPRLQGLAHHLKNHTDLQQRLVELQGEQGRATLRGILEGLSFDSPVELLTVLDAAGMVLYRAHDAGTRGDRPALPGLTRALAGEESIQVSRDAMGLVVQNASPN
jgi:hypothetical protein